MGIFEGLLSWEVWAALATLTFLEIILGIDNLLFLSILLTKVSPARQTSVRLIGLSMAAAARIALLVSLYWSLQWTTPLLTWDTIQFSGRDLILIGGGVFLLWKSSQEIYVTCEQPAHVDQQTTSRVQPAAGSLMGVYLQIVLVDLVFSLDSVITAIGMTNELWIMAVAILLALMLMLWASQPISRYLKQHNSLKVLALAFLILLGVLLIADGFHVHIPRGYLYFAMAFSTGVELLNFRLRRQRS